MLGRSILVALVGALALAAPAMAGAQTTPTLDGESLGGVSSDGAAFTFTCDPAGVSSASYTVSGTAIGTFAGTFVESGSYTIVDGEVTAFEATFTIQSPLGDVEGSKTLRSSSVADCGTTEGVAFNDVLLTADYQATLTTSAGVFADEGTALTSVQMTRPATGGALLTMQEGFASERLGTAGHVTAGGYIGDLVDGRVTFALSARSDGTSVEAQCTVMDHVIGTRVKCLDATLLARTATHAVVEGTALVNGTEWSYHIEVDDLGEPGPGRDTFAIVTGNGFARAGVLAGGNVRIHD